MYDAAFSQTGLCLEFSSREFRSTLANHKRVNVNHHLTYLGRSDKIGVRNRGNFIMEFERQFRDLWVNIFFTVSFYLLYLRKQPFSREKVI